MSKKLIVIGGGASGFFCAVNAAKLSPDLQVFIFEKQAKVLQKVKVSGGGRCNVTHACFQASALLKKYPRGKSLLKKTLAAFGPQATINWFAERGVPLHTESDGRMFPQSNDSQTIINCLLQEASTYHVQLQLHTEIVSLRKESGQFLLVDQQQKKYKADFVMLATGGLTKPAQYAWLQDLGHAFQPPVPSLFTFNMPQDPICKLMGISVPEAMVKIAGTQFQESGPLLITHWGLSGPAILKLSAWGARDLQACQYQFSVLINWVMQPEHSLREQWPSIRVKQSNLLLSQKNPFGLPQRLWEYFLQQCQIAADTRWSELSGKSQNKLINILTTQALHVKGKTTFKEEFVTCGGIVLDDIDGHTMESKKINGLYFGGELLDVDGITGGFNFQHAWSSGYIAAKSICEHMI